jgi:hypothetical protein
VDSRYDCALNKRERKLAWGNGPGHNTKEKTNMHYEYIQPTAQPTLKPVPMQSMLNRELPLYTKTMIDVLDCPSSKTYVRIFKQQCRQEIISY